MNTFSKSLIIATTLFATTGAAVAIAGPGMGYAGKHSCKQQYGMDGPGAGMGMGPGHGMKHGHRKMGRAEAMFDRIPDLTAEQRQQLTQLKAEQHAAKKGMRTAMMEQRQQADQQLMQEFKSARQTQRESFKARLGEILTDEQKAALPIFQH